MVTDIFARAERLVDGNWETIPDIYPFDGWSSYRLFGFLADVRNYSAVKPVSTPRGLPPGVVQPPEPDDGNGEEWLGDHDHSWLLLSELLAVNYAQAIEDRRNNGLTLPSGSGEKMTLRQFLGEPYFAEIHRLQASGVERIIFGFGS